MERDLPLDDLTRFAAELARRAGKVTLEHFQRGVMSEFKGDGTPVTVADRGAEELVRRTLHERFPDDGVVGEEYGAEASRSGRTWIVDPIDGTRSFVHGVPLYSVLLALEIAGRTVLGVIHLPALGETIAAWRGGGCWWNGQRVQVSKVTRLDEGLVALSELPQGAERERLAPLLRAARLARTWGDAYGYALVATGRAEVMLDPEASVWDLAAVQPIIEEAGGRFTDLAGEPSARNGSGVATNGHLHETVLELVKDR